jgi:hypothetical protein
MARQSERIEIPWAELVGGQDNEAWAAYLTRKFQRIKLKATECTELAAALVQRHAVTRCSPEVLRDVPDSASWYVALAGYSRNHLRNIQQPANLSTKLDTFLKKLAKSPSSASTSDLAAFSDWANYQLSQLPGLPQDPALCTLHVAMVFGAMVVGQVQNESQYIPHAILKGALLEHFTPRQHWQYATSADADWRPVDPDSKEAMTAAFWRYTPTDAVLDLTTGGQRPDVRVERNGRTELAGEIKGRMDVSNLWESWLPQAIHHMQAWSNEYPQSLRGVFMTIFTAEAIDGRDDRSGLKKCASDGHLQFAINLTHLASGQAQAVQQFKAVFDRVLGVQQRD